MKVKSCFTAVVLTGAVMLTFCAAGCNQVSEEKTAENSVTISEDSEEASAEQVSQAESSAQKENSKPQESSLDEKQIRTEQAKKDITVLLEYKKGLESVKDIKWNVNDVDGGVGNDYGRLYYVDSVIRDINEDGGYELIVKYDLRAVNFKDSTVVGRDQYNFYPAFTYDIVRVVDGKAVATEHYMNEEGLYHQGEEK